MIASIFSPLEQAGDALARVCGLDPTLGAGAAVSFFVYELVKVSLLILAISWLMALVRRALPVEAMRRWLATPIGRVLGYPAAALFGAVTPFCSCSSVPLFIGFIEARLPVGVALAFLITSPLVNEIVVALFLASFGWQVALLYVAAGLALGVIGGWTLQLIGAERWLTTFALRQSQRATSPAGRAHVIPLRVASSAPIPVDSAAAPVSVAVQARRAPSRTWCGDTPLQAQSAQAETCCSGGSPQLPEITRPGPYAGNASASSAGSCGCTGKEAAPESPWRFARREARDIYLGVLPYLAVALLIGAGIHGFVPQHFFATYFAQGRWWDVPAAVLVGFPLYASANATVPILETLVAKGVPLGTGMAFIMSAVGVSLPELIILKRVMTLRLLVAFAATVSLGVVAVGCLFNAVF